MPPSNLARLRKICLGLPKAIEVEAWGSPTFRIGKIFAMYAQPDNHHGEGREGVWLKTDSFTQDLLVRGMPLRYFKPPYVGPFGWTGVYLDAKTDWIALTDLVRDAYRGAAPKKLAALLTDDDDVAPATASKPRRRAGVSRPVAKRTRRPAKKKVAKRAK